MAKIIDGKQISLDIKNELKEKVAKYKEQGIEITLAVVKVGNDPASAVYVRNKEKACEYVGINSKTLALPEETTEEENNATPDNSESEYPAEENGQMNLF